MIFVAARRWIDSNLDFSHFDDAQEAHAGEPYSKICSITPVQICFMALELIPHFSFQHLFSKNKSLLHLVTCFSICDLHVSLESRLTPSKLALSDTSICLPLNCRSRGK